MAWYDVFSSFYDSSLEKLYAPQRVAAGEALQLAPRMTVLDLPCGTGASLPVLREGVGAGGTLVGVDASPGMLRQAEARVAARGWSNVRLLERRAQDVTREDLDQALGDGVPLDRVLCFLGLTTFDAWEEGFAATWRLLRPGGRYVIVDVYNERPGLQGWMVELIARADLRRRVWEPLEQAGEGFTLSRSFDNWQHGGDIVIAAATKPRE